jgi:phasin
MHSAGAMNDYVKVQAIAAIKSKQRSEDRTSAQGVASKNPNRKRPRMRNMTATTTPTKPTSFSRIDAPKAFNDMAEKGVTQAKEAYGKMSAATTDAADLLKSSFSSAVKGAQDYNSKVLEFAHVNTNAAFEFVQRLAGVTSPTAFVELSTEHTRKQVAILTEQTKELAALAQKAAAASAEPLKAGAAKALNQAA